MGVFAEGLETGAKAAPSEKNASADKVVPGEKSMPGEKTVPARRTARPLKTAAGYLAAAALPVAVLCCVAASTGVYPFGEQSFLTEDLRYQYVDFFLWFRRVLFGEDSLFYSFSQSLGSNTWGLWSYYLASPLNLLVAAFPASRVTDAVFAIVAAKLALAGASAHLYLRRRFGLATSQALTLGTGWAASLWVLTQLRNPMWMDVLVMVPLVALAAWRLARTGRWGALTATLVASIVFCWYTGYMTVIFAVCLVALEAAVARADAARSACARGAAAQPEPGAAVPASGSATAVAPAGEVAGSATVVLPRLLGALCLTVGLVAWTFYPTVVVQLGHWSGTLTVALLAASAVLLALGLVFVQVRFSPRVLRAVTRALAVLCVLGACAAGAYAVKLYGIDGLAERLVRPGWFLIGGVRDFVASLGSGTWRLNAMPQLYCGAAALFGTLAFAFDKNIDVRVRRAGVVFAAAMLASVALRPLYVAWCGFKVPGGFLSRTAFIFVFACMWCAAAWLERVPRERRHSRRTLAAAAAALALLALAAVASRTDAVGSTVWSAIVVLAVAGAFAPVRAARADAGSAPAGSAADAPAPRTAADRFIAFADAVLPPVMLALELVTIGQLAWPQMYHGYTQDDYNTYVQQATDELSELRGVDADAGAYRIEKTYTRAGWAAWSEGLVQGFDRVASYTSSSDPSAVEFLSRLGYSNAGELSVAYRTPLPATDALLGVRYVFSRIPLMGEKTAAALGYSLVELDAAAQAGHLVYQNSRALGTGFAASAEVCGVSAANALTASGTTDPFELQNQPASALLGREVSLYTPLAATKTADDGAGTASWHLDVPAGLVPCGWINSSSRDYYAWSVADEAAGATDTSSAEAGSPYAGVAATWAKNTDMWGDSWDNWRFGHAVRMLGDVEDAARGIGVTVSFADFDERKPVHGEKTSVDCLFYALDPAVYNELIDALSARQLAVQERGHARLAGTFDAGSGSDAGAAGSDQGLLLTIPYDTGWTVRVDGEEVAAEPAADGAFTYVPLSGRTGTVTLEMTYLPPALLAGCAVTAVFAAALLARAALIRRQATV